MRRKKMKILHKPFHKGDKYCPANAKPLKIIEIRYTDGSVEKPGKGIVKPAKPAEKEPSRMKKSIKKFKLD